MTGGSAAQVAFVKCAYL